MPGMRLRAFAKLNLALAVAPQGRDGPRKGWHRICSWMHAIDLCDEVEVSVDGSLKGPVLDARWAQDAPVHAGEPVAWPAEKDLALRAATLLGANAPLRITIRKRIPDGGGLGGGSSNAAAVLRAGDALLGLHHGPAKLREMAMTLGSDIAFFIDDTDPHLDAPPRPAIVGGFGEAIERLAAPREPVDVTLALPPFGCHTGEVYTAFDGLSPGPLRAAEVRSIAAQSPRVAMLFNDLAPAAERVRPELAALRARLVEVWETPVHVTGSGSTLFTFGRHDTTQDGPTVVQARLV
jgi:4-diphosphocytidyl-2-C-methyl-D-erythritol kinase